MTQPIDMTGRVKLKTTTVDFSKGAYPLCSDCMGLGVLCEYHDCGDCTECVMFVACHCYLTANPERSDDEPE